MFPSIVSRGFGNGSYSGTETLAVTRGYKVAVAAVTPPTQTNTLDYWTSQSSGLDYFTTQSNTLDYP